MARHVVKVYIPPKLCLILLRINNQTGISEGEILRTALVWWFTLRGFFEKGEIKKEDILD